MTAASALAFPGSRALAGWWRQLAARCPEEIWVGYLSLHRVEALVELTRPCRLDPFAVFLLGAVRMEQGRRHDTPNNDQPRSTPAELLRTLDTRFHLGCGLLHQALRGLVREGLLREGGPRGWALTVLGEQALEHGEYPVRSQERRSFHFVQSRDGSATPHFLNLNSHGNTPTPVSETWDFDPAALGASLARAPEWKARYGFPAEVSAVLGPPAGAPVAAWEEVIVHRPERLLVVLVRVAGGEGRERLLGFAARQEGWALQGSTPALVIESRWDELFPELTAGLPQEAWRRAWLAWCQPRGLPAGGPEACVLEPMRERLRVHAPARLIDRLRETRSDAIKGEAWLLAGEGTLRRAALIELVEQSGS
jgi:hypothetical protein